MFEQFRQIERKESFAQLFRNLKIAFVAALTAWSGLLLYDYEFLKSAYLRQMSDWFEPLILNVLLLGYPIIAIVLWRCRETFVVERFPVWLSISILGSILSMSLHSLMFQIFGTENYGIKFNSPGGAEGFIAMYSATLLSFYVAPITAAFYYSPRIVKALKQMISKG